jgi:CheY-like chemotaxis protein
VVDGSQCHHAQRIMYFYSWFASGEMRGALNPHEQERTLPHGGFRQHGPNLIAPRRAECSVRRVVRTGGAPPECRKQKFMRILVIEDDDSVRLLFAEILERSGYDVHSTDSAFGAATLVRDLHPSAVLLDIGLPFRPGTALLDELKSDPTTSGVPVILVSGLVEGLSEERRGLATAVLEKPVSVSDLLMALGQVAGARREGEARPG